MKAIIELKPWRALAASVCLALASHAWADPEANEVEGSTAKIQWGTHWAGPEIQGGKSLEGKVVLLKIWGG